MIAGLQEVMDRHGLGPDSPLARDLATRENNMADQLRMAGVQFGLFPEIVAEVLAQVGLGDDPSPEGRDMIRRNFVAKMEELRRQFGQ